MLPTTVSINLFVLVVGMVAALMLIIGASLRPFLEELMDKASRRLRIEVHDDRKIIIYVPEGVVISWLGKTLDRVIQHEVVLENSTHDVFHEIQLRIRLEPFNALLDEDVSSLGIVVPPTPNASPVILPSTTAGERIIEMGYLSAMSQVKLLVFSQVDGELKFNTLCDHEIVVRHTGSAFSENVEKVMPTWAMVLRPIVWPLTFVAMVRNALLRRERK